MPADREHPMPGQVLMTVATWADEDYENPDDGREEVTDLDHAHVVTSRVIGAPDLHRPVLDLDFPAKLIPSTTEGHFHLYLDVDLTWEDYVELLRLLGRLGVLEEGYVGASIARGHTSARLPWIKKELVPADPAPAARVPADPWESLTGAAF